MPPDERQALRVQLLANGASVIAVAWRVGDSLDLPPDPSDLVRDAGAPQQRAREATDQPGRLHRRGTEP